ncbi:acyltransferase family protein [Streptococcus oricebi]|uniref:Acetyltransferase n=1 Tax=Streptococcus oricebi TaxID=1547447 RepID=A0ABS5B5T8_9STRE|nr:acyltransferase family protein [Streptococcus oricebi]MBP2624203.1 acetyltransferase [Streptococcus oricebi]
MRIKWFSLVRITGLILVLLYHFFQGLFPGGFIGVDIFFAFSGFLITSLLIDEFARSSAIDLLGFFKRRFYRIVPPLVFMILLIMPFTLLVRKDFVAGIGSQIAASLGFVTNFFEIMSGGNYESQFIPHLFIHSWSLALEVHFYLFWGLGVWFLAKKSQSISQLRGFIFLLSTGLFLASFLAMFLGAFFTKNFTSIYFASWTHIFPFFAGAALATVSGVASVGVNFKKMEEAWTIKKAWLRLALSFSLLVVLSFLLKFDQIWTYLFGFLLATVLALEMILATRILHDKTPNRQEPAWLGFVADTSYGVYLFHWPFYIIFSQLMNNLLAVILTTILSFGLAALSYYVLEPSLAGRRPQLTFLKLDATQISRPIFYSLLPLTLLTLLIMATAPKIGAFEESLMVNGLNQAKNKLDLTRSQIDQAQATEYNVTAGVSLIGDSVALRASQWLETTIPGIQLDAVVSRNLASGLEVYQTAISNKILLQDVVLALGANTVDNYEEALNQLIDQLPKGHRLILVTPYDGRVASDENSSLAKTRQYEQELAKKYDYVYLADWYQVAQDNPDIWQGTDQVHFGSESNSIAQGGQLYAQTIKEALDQASQGPVKP